MKRNSILFLMFLFVLTNGIGTATAQFNIKIPKINKPKVEQPKTDGSSTNTPTNSDANQNPSKKSGGDPAYMAKPRPTNVPVLLKHTVEVKPYRGTSYWKTPNERDHSSWMPLIRFGLFYDESETMRYNVEWLNPDGSLWFSQPLEDEQTRYSSEIFDTKSTDAAGTYGFRLVNPKTKEIVYQGKFNVKKMPLFPNDPKQKNNATFYTDNDWVLPYGYVGFEDSASWEKDPQPTVYMWFKGGVKREDLEARLFHNNQQIISTDDGGTIEDGSLFDERRNENNCFQQPEICGYQIWKFTWKMSVESFNKDATAGTYARYPNILYTKDKPGEYTVKIFHKGVQVRETKFSVQPNGWLETNKFASQMPMRNYRALIPVKIMGTLDKWNPAAWKTESFYGNQLSGFSAP